MIASIVLALAAWAFLADMRMAGGSFFIGPLPTGLSAIAIAVAAYSYFFASEKLQTISAYTAYLILVGATGVLLATTGISSSPFIALWMATAVFAGVFGIQTLALMFAVVNIIFAVEFFGGTISRQLILNLILAGELPILISYIMWHSKSRHEQNKEKAYYNLANELNQVSNKAEVVINAIADGVIAINDKGLIDLINPAAQRIVGWGRQDAVGLDYKSVLQLLDKNGHELTRSNDPIYELLVTNQQQRTDDLLLQTSGGKRLATSVVASPIGRLGSGAIIVFRDITKEIAEGKEQAEFISTASHEMRTPVASIEGYLGLALNPATATIDEKARNYITKAHEAAQHLGRLFQDLLDVSKADDRRMSNNPKVINAVEFANSIIDALKSKADAKQLSVLFKPSGTGGSESSGLHNVAPVFYLYADNDHLREVLSNLVENAIKYTPAGQVLLDVTGDRDHVVISVTDSGIGIPAEDIPHLFQKFYRVDNSDTREIGGTGLGLYLCRRLIEAMDGRIWVESEYKKGSTFFIELPRISHEEANRLIEAASNEEQSGEESSFVKINNELESSPEEQRAAMLTPIVHKPGRILGDTPEAPTASQSNTAFSLAEPQQSKPSVEQLNAPVEGRAVNPSATSQPDVSSPAAPAPAPQTPSQPAEQITASPAAAVAQPQTQSQPATTSAQTPGQSQPTVPNSTAERPAAHYVGPVRPSRPISPPPRT